MATVTLPELIQPGILYSPNDAPFSVSAGALPNTDDALIIDGSIANARAYQPAISGVHYPALQTDPMTVMFWANFNHATARTLSGISTWFPTGHLMGVMDINMPVKSAGGGAATAGFRWGIAVDPLSRRF